MSPQLKHPNICWDLSDALARRTLLSYSGNTLDSKFAKDDGAMATLSDTHKFTCKGDFGLELTCAENFLPLTCCSYDRDRKDGLGSGYCFGVERVSFGVGLRALTGLGETARCFPIGDDVSADMLLL